MMLCIAEAVIEDKGVSLQNIARHFKEWALGDPMGIGENTYKVLSIGDYVEGLIYRDKLEDITRCLSNILGQTGED